MRSTQECDLSRFEALARKVREARGLLVRALNDQLAGVYVWQRVVRLARAVCLSLPQNLNELLVQLVRVGESFSLRKLLHYFLVLLDVLVYDQVRVHELLTRALIAQRAPSLQTRNRRCRHVVQVLGAAWCASAAHTFARLFHAKASDRRLFLVLLSRVLLQQLPHSLLFGFELGALLLQGAPLLRELRLLPLTALVALGDERLLLAQGLVRLLNHARLVLQSGLTLY